MLALHTRNAGVCDIYETRPTEDQMLVVLTRGSLDMESYAGGRWNRAVFQAGLAGSTAPGEVDRLRWRLRPGCQAFETLHLFVPHGLIAEAVEHVRRPGRRDPSASFSSLIIRDGALAHVATALLSAMQAGAPELYAQATAQWLAVHLVATLLGPDLDDARRPAPITDARLSRALDYMSANMAADVTLDAIAAEAGVSKFHFVKLFRERLGETPIRHLTGLRLEAAARLLATSDLPVSRVAFECGFANSAHFSSAFRRRYGLAPNAYRQAK